MCVLILLAASQDDSLEARVRCGVEGFASNDPEVRERATRTLRALGSSALPALLAILKEPRDPETHARIRDVIKDHWVAQANTLFSEGRLREALLALAGAENPGNPEAHFKTRLELARKDLLSEIEDPGEVPINRKPPSGSALKEKHGRWGLAVVLELLHPKGLDRPSHAFDLLKSWRADPIFVPVFVVALKDPNDLFVGRICDLLLFFGRNSAEVRTALALLERDDARGERLRSLARDVLIELGGKPEKR